MVSASESDILTAVRAKLGDSKSAGSKSAAASKVDLAELERLLSVLELENDWDPVSHKKFKAVLTKNNLLDDPSTAYSTGNAKTEGANGSSSKKKKKSAAGVPKSFIDSAVSIPVGLRAEYFNAFKGKGLVADSSFSHNDVLFTEDAYVPTPPPEALGQVNRGELCGQCFLPISSAASSLATKSCNKCSYKFCSLACVRKGMATHHMLLCSGYNPASKTLLALIEAQTWQSLHSVARSLARLLSPLTPHNNNADDLIETFGNFEEVHARLSSFATVSELERRARNPGWSTEKASFEAVLLKAHTALREALDPFYEARVQARDATDSGKSFEPHFVRMDLVDAVKSRKAAIKELFDYPQFLKLLGRSNINMEKFGGLYSVHSFLNHSCSPNVAIRHVPERNILASMKVAAVALREIQKDEELVISYIDPATPLGRRQLVLYRDYCFGPCTCPKCTTELSELGLTYDPSKDGVKGFLDSIATKTGVKDASKGDDNAGLEQELKASLGF